MDITNKRNGKVLAQSAVVADTCIKRMKGLMFKASFERGQGLFIYPCNMIHMFFMKFSIDVLFLSKEKEVVYAIEGIAPRKISPLVRKAAGVLELPSGTIRETGTQRGDVLIFSYKLK